MLQNKLMYVEIDASAVFHKICWIKCSWHFYMKFIISSISKKASILQRNIRHLSDGNL